ncbi:methylenetetrahydrofolate reductase [Fructilactobacillus carniphilus]|uniref:Methylenetetrahydrofolate reductase n=1 Tax=Fructilactobacillus carniphilus TaxID=2940297 RepID=A0ABY5BYB2_9LACO|nr:methylenetetrahydrofolate reductase [Fructilactobacillus carniphilus]USS90363.1 methylenetetrahydrofolate reductase [Fructilactobacillus carniphilus]
MAMMTSPLGIEISPATTSLANQRFIEASGIGTTIRPDFVSVTWSAGGKDNPGKPYDLIQQLERNQLQVLPHLTGLYKTPTAITQELHELTRLGVKRVLALRGDVNHHQRPTGYFPHATNLIRYIKQHSQLKIAAAAYPERHPESDSWGTELFYLRAKVQAGATELFTQFCFDVPTIFRWLDRIHIADIRVPVVVGVLPLTSQTRIQQAEIMLGHPLPMELKNRLAVAQTESELRAIGIQVALEQIYSLQRVGVGVQIYTFNDVQLLQTIWKTIK